MAEKPDKYELRLAVRQPANLQLTHESGQLLYGGNQAWYRLPWRRMAGCGPSTAANLLLYLHRSGQITLPDDVRNQADFTALMEAVWKYITPGLQGLIVLEDFCRGFTHYLETIGSVMRCHTLAVAKRPEERPALDSVIRFIAAGLAADCPVAFLNLSSGNLSELENWHWVTIMALASDPRSGRVLIDCYDNTRQIHLDLGEWFRSTKLGGGFIYFAAGTGCESAN